MPSGALFGSTSALGGSSGGSKHLVEFRAGRMTMKGKTVNPDKRKGFLYLYQSDDSLIHFCWKDRTTGVVEDDLIIFPDDCEFIKVSQCTTGRVFVLKFKTSSRRFFFWMQEPKTDKDEEWCRRINEVLNNPPAVGSSGRGGSSQHPDGDLQNLLNNMSQQQLMQLFGGVGQITGLSSLLGTMRQPSTGSTRVTSGSPSSARSPSTTTTPAVAAVTTAAAPPETPKAPAATRIVTAARPAPVDTPVSASRQQIQLSDLQSYLSTLTSPPGADGAPAANTNTPVVVRPNVDLSTALTTDVLASVVADESRVAELQPHLPNTTETQDNSTTSGREQLRSTLASPQFQQAVSMFSSALQSGQLGPVVAQFAVDPEAVEAANQGDLEKFVKALEGKSSTTTVAPAKPPGDSEKDKDKKDDEDEGMSLG